MTTTNEGGVKQEEGSWRWLWPWFLALVVLLTLGARYAEPVRDGDLWWQMAYGRHLVENRTLIPDHTAFTWTPTRNDSVYCAWLTEMLLYLLYRVGDLPLLFAFRYLGLLILVLAVWWMTSSLGRQTDGKAHSDGSIQLHLDPERVAGGGPNLYVEFRTQRPEP